MEIMTVQYSSNQIWELESGGDGSEEYPFEDDDYRILCPICGSQWWKDDNPGNHFPCEHLKFVWSEGFDFIPYDKVDDFVQEYEKLCEIDGIEPISDDDGISRFPVDSSRLEKVICTSISAIYLLDESGALCGDDGVAIFGVKA